MSDERRGTDGGDLPLDVDARFADIVAHFHDGEPAPPRVVDSHHGPGDADEPADGDASAHGGTASLTARGPDGGTPDAPAARVDRVTGDVPVDGPARLDAEGYETGDPGTRGYDSRADEAATSWAARYEQAAREELAAHEERIARARRERRIEAEVERAVDGTTERFVPDEPPPLPRPADLPARLAWGAVLLGPVALVLFALLWRSAPPWLVGSVVTAVVAGFCYLVWRLPRTHDRDDGGDGAIV